VRECRGFQVQSQSGDFHAWRILLGRAHRDEPGERLRHNSADLRKSAPESANEDGMQRQRDTKLAQAESNPLDATVMEESYGSCGRDDE